jgi:hypothetical protein
MALKITATSAITSPMIQPATFCEVRIAPSAAPIPTTPLVAITRTKADSSGGRSRRSGNIEALADADPAAFSVLRPSSTSTPDQSPNVSLTAVYPRALGGKQVSRGMGVSRRDVPTS